MAVLCCPYVTNFKCTPTPLQSGYQKVVAAATTASSALTTTELLPDTTMQSEITISMSLQTCFPAKIAEGSGCHLTSIFQVLHECIPLVHLGRHLIPSCKELCKMCFFSFQPLRSGMYLMGASNDQTISGEQSPLESNTCGD